LHIPLLPLHDLLLLFCFPTTAHSFCAASATNTGASSDSCTSHSSSARSWSWWRIDNDLSVLRLCDCSPKLSLSCQGVLYVSHSFCFSLRLIWSHWLNADPDCFTTNMPPKSGSKRKGVRLVSYAANIAFIVSWRL
jgi:hypothetical protein